ncbi:MAG: succinyl-diaminopimelate desuccinylase [Geminicoccaceae bacterium]|nr:MAG: succinyl-diaminopimelate desuccinylase [Geminicoccaceae bacterium]
MTLTDPVPLAAALVRVPSVTPDDGTCLGLVAGWLEQLGARLWWVEEPGEPRVANLVARLGEGGRRFAFAGHTDVVPPGDEALWRFSPFAGDVVDGQLRGRGACDMKGGVAAAVAAAARLQAEGGLAGEWWFYLTGDEEGPSVRGTAAIVRWLQREGFGFDGCIVGEPTSSRVVGDTLKVGRRGSFTARITVEGVQGHTAYPLKADNPIHRLARIVAELASSPLDAGTDRFEPSSLQVTTFDVANPASNVIPAKAEAVLNIRFNTLHDGLSLETWLAEVAERHAPGRSRVAVTSLNEAFFAGDGGFARLVADAVVAGLGVAPRPSTGGGTSDARFLKDLGPVVELGTVGHSLHQANEYVGTDELEALTLAYRAVAQRFFEAG